MAVADGRLYATGNTANTDILSCLNADTGDLIWKYEYDEPLAPNLYEGGPSATPTVDGDKVFVLSRSGRLACLDAATGSEKWAVDMTELTGAPVPGWGFGGSPVVYKDLLLLNVGDSGAAVKKDSGELVWKSAPEEAGYTTPKLVSREDGDYAIFSSGRDFTGRDLETGEEVARWEWKTRYGINAADPIVDGDRIFISSGYRKGATVVDISSGEPVEVWKNKEMQNQMNPSVLVDGYLYGCSGDQNDRSTPLKCISMENGETQWEFPGIGTGNVMVAKDHLIVLSARGTLYFAPVSPEGFEPVFQMQALGGKCWTAPVLANGRLYCRNANGDLVCLDLRG